jgi:phosphoribosylaminoimidazole-succinocarboxamide synthase
LRLEEIGLEDTPKPGQVLEKPILEVSTKLEASDRYMGWDEARRICGLSEGETRGDQGDHAPNRQGDKPRSRLG